MIASAEQIRQSLETVAYLRQQRAANTLLAKANAEVKRFQARRFQATYQDLLSSARHKPAARFFLVELYSDKDYAERDQQFSRIATTIAKLFPQTVVDTAVALTAAHALTEQLDNMMAHCWMASSISQPNLTEESRYIQCWRCATDAHTRQRQLEMVLSFGQSLNALTRKPGLRTLLKLMRAPAAAAGLATLQKFLETGFDAFATMRGADEFLLAIDARETQWITGLFEEDAVICEEKLIDLFAKNS